MTVPLDSEAEGRMLRASCWLREYHVSYSMGVWGLPRETPNLHFSFASVCISHSGFHTFSSFINYISICFPHTLFSCQEVHLYRVCWIRRARSPCFLRRIKAKLVSLASRSLNFVPLDDFCLFH